MRVENALAMASPSPVPPCCAVAGPHAVEHVEDPVAVRLRNAGSLIVDRDGDGFTRPLPCRNDDRRNRGAVFARHCRGCSPAVCSSRIGSTLIAGKVSGTSTLTLELAKLVACNCRTARPTSSRGSTPFRIERQGAIADPGHVEEVLDVAVQPLALVADRLGELHRAPSRPQRRRRPRSGWSPRR